MTTTATAASSADNDSGKRLLVMLFANLTPIIFSLLLTGLFFLLGQYEIKELVPAKTDLASIDYPVKGKAVGNSFVAKGTLSTLPAGAVAYLMVKRDELYWPKKYLGQTSGGWSKEITEPKRKNSRLSLVILAMDAEGRSRIDRWYKTTRQTGKYPGLNLADISDAQEIARVEVKQ